MIETVKIVKDNHTGYAIINKSDFDTAKHELFGSEPSGPTVKELAAELKELGVSVPRGASKAMMVELLAKAKQE